jgi:rfaE bifunctional protein nucleotidyltransferase chain/domain
MHARFESKILSWKQCLAAIAAGRLKRPLVFTNGVFDILHRGHVTYLDESAQLGASLLVAVNTDRSVRQLGKGQARPLNGQEDRLALLAALACVDAVTTFDEATPEALIAVLQPNIIVKGGDYDMEKLPETTLVQSWGGEAVAIPFVFSRSTTALIRKIHDDADQKDTVSPPKTLPQPQAD